MERTNAQRKFCCACVRACVCGRYRNTLAAISTRMKISVLIRSARCVCNVEIDGGRLITRPETRCYTQMDFMCVNGMHQSSFSCYKHLRHKYIYF